MIAVASIADHKGDRDNSCNYRKRDVSFFHVRSANALRTNIGQVSSRHERPRFAAANHDKGTGLGAVPRSFFEIVYCGRTGADKIEHHPLVLRHSEMTNTLWLREEAACRPLF
jgi:hypothetical protein